MVGHSIRWNVFVACGFEYRFRVAFATKLFSYSGYCRLELIGDENLTGEVNLTDVVDSVDCGLLTL